MHSYLLKRKRREDYYKMGFVLFILGFTIGFFTCNIIRNIKELNRQKSNTVKALSKMDKQEFKKAMKDLEIN